MSETITDGIVAAFHSGADQAHTIAAALAPKMRGVTSDALAGSLSMNSRGPLFRTPPFVVTGTYVQASPCDDRCVVGEVEIRPDAVGVGRVVEISGEMFKVRRLLA